MFWMLVDSQFELLSFSWWFDECTNKWDGGTHNCLRNLFEIFGSWGYDNLNSILATSIIDLNKAAIFLSTTTLDPASNLNLLIEELFIFLVDTRNTNTHSKWHGSDWLFDNIIITTHLSRSVLLDIPLFTLSLRWTVTWWDNWSSTCWPEGSTVYIDKELTTFCLHEISFSFENWLLILTNQTRLQYSV